MRVVLDTNILLSSLISPHGLPDKIYHAWRAARFELVTSADQLNELRRASRYPKFKNILQPHRVGAMINNMQCATILKYLPQLPENIQINDPNDIFFNFYGYCRENQLFGDWRLSCWPITAGHY